MAVRLRRRLATLLLGLLLAVPAAAQDSAPPRAGTGGASPPRAGTEAEAANSKQRDRDVREQDFRPSEEISQDASVAFPVDI